jgi:hypothetical protein
VATAHAADHYLGVVIYGRKAVAATGGNPDAEVARQLARLPDDLRPLVVSALRRRIPSLRPHPKSGTRNPRIRG